MKRTGPTPLVILGVVGIVVGFLLETGIVAAGGAIVVPPISLAITLVAVAAIVIGFAVPVRRAVRGQAKTRIDPFRAMRVAVLAKASSLSGAVLTGWAIGVLAYLLTRTIVASTTSIWLTVAAVIGAVVLLVAGLVAESFCVLPPDDKDEEHAGGSSPAHH